MASTVYTTALGEMLDGTIDIDNDTIKVMLLGSANATYSPDPDHDVIDNGGNDSSDPSYCELQATNYTGGQGGAGRKTATVSVQVDKTNDRAEIVITDLTWSSLGGAANDTITHALLVKESGNDTTSRVIACWDVTDTLTNGGDVTLDFDAAEGNIRIATA